MIKIGQRVLIANFPQLQIPQGDEAEIDIDVFNWKLKLQVAFEDSGTDQGIRLLPLGTDGVRLVFQNWSNSLGITLMVPGKLALLQAGGALEFMAANYRIGSTNILSLQLLHNPEAK